MMARVRAAKSSVRVHVRQGTRDGRWFSRSIAGAGTRGTPRSGLVSRFLRTRERTPVARTLPSPGWSGASSPFPRPRDLSRRFARAQRNRVLGKSAVPLPRGRASWKDPPGSSRGAGIRPTAASALVGRSRSTAARSCASEHAHGRDRPTLRSYQAEPEPGSGGASLPGRQRSCSRRLRRHSNDAVHNCRRTRP